MKELVKGVISNRSIFPLIISQLSPTEGHSEPMNSLPDQHSVTVDRIREEGTGRKGGLRTGYELTWGYFYMMIFLLVPDLRSQVLGYIRHRITGMDYCICIQTPNAYILRKKLLDEIKSGEDRNRFLTQGY